MVIGDGVGSNEDLDGGRSEWVDRVPECREHQRQVGWGTRGTHKAKGGVRGVKHGQAAKEGATIWTWNECGFDEDTTSTELGGSRG